MYARTQLVRRRRQRRAGIGAGGSSRTATTATDGKRERSLSESYGAPSGSDGDSGDIDDSLLAIAGIMAEASGTKHWIVVKQARVGTLKIVRVVPVAFVVEDRIGSALCRQWHSSRNRVAGAIAADAGAVRANSTANPRARQRPRL